MKNILTYLEETAKTYPSKIAVIEPDKTCDYQTLHTRAKRAGIHLAHYFSQNDPVIIFKEKSISTLSTMMAVVYAGCHYVIVDPEQPDERLASIVNVLNTDKIIADKEHEERLVNLNLGLQVIKPDDLLRDVTDDGILEQRRSAQISTDPLYIMFTSGSTGIPKGVVVSHGSVIDFIDDFTNTFAITDQDVMANQAPFDFDVSVKDIYSCLKTGASLLLIPKTYFSDPMRLLDYLCDHESTILVWAVSALCILTTFKALNYKIPHHLRSIMFSGERMPSKHLNTWRKALPMTNFVNLYGPTEITCNCTYYQLQKDENYADELPIGQSFNNDRVLLFNDEDQLITNANDLGEICVAGASLSLGYYNNPEQTNKSFIQNPLNQNYRELIYRTGDLGYYNEKGELCIKGRKDFQIKHMGHRIELEEIEKKIEEHDKVMRACCIYHEKKYKIYAIYQGSIEVKDLIAFLEEKLPKYMIPNTFIQVKEMPLSKNGKINRQQLKMEVGIQS